ncbi:hypothetical protein E1295_01295 [Nonomuraea mesophila]|uniref:Uncharacterized protein n=1 Tax=Nonomuraea mesophila TaxID=2530382 RepID=A0A4R5FYQ6_9ACTN|nr:hypothetical protein [Nonomuraea mesophila]TDE59920.1 hypothetical protein E1295_01295 [Nonomuraea mesophila]
MATSPARSRNSRRSSSRSSSSRASAPVQPSGGRPPKGQSIAFMGALLTHLIFVVLLLPRGYNPWVAVAAASTACLGAGRVTRMMALGPPRQGTAGAVLTPSFFARVATLVIRAAVTPRPQDNDPPDTTP